MLVACVSLRIVDHALRSAQYASFVLLCVGWAGLQKNQHKTYLIHPMMWISFTELRDILVPSQPIALMHNGTIINYQPGVSDSQQHITLEYSFFSTRFIFRIFSYQISLFSSIFSQKYPKIFAPAARFFSLFPLNIRFFRLRRFIFLIFRFPSLF